MTDIAAAFLREIIKHPEDDADRLIFADWLAEHGDETRAEFIRVQVELASLDDGSGAQPVQPNQAGVSLEEWHALRRRERELLEAHSWRWLREAVPFADGIRGATFIFRRGFIASVTLTLAAWCGTRCHDCGRAALLGPATADCTVCHGTGRAGGHADNLTASAPIEVVRFTTPSEPAILSLLAERWPKITFIFP